MPVVSGDAAWISVADHVKITPYSGGDTNRNDSAVLLADGRVLYVFVEGNAVKEGRASSVLDFRSVNGSVTGVTTILAVDVPSACAMWVGAELVLVVAYRVPSSNTYKTDVYKSPSGAGGDWAFFVNIQTMTGAVNNSGNGSFSSQRYVGEILVAAAGRWVLPAGSWQDIGGSFTAYRAAIWISDDSGVTWSLRSIPPTADIDSIGDRGVGRNVVSYGGVLYNAAGNNRTGVSYYLRKSTDNGTTWTTVFQGDRAGFNFPNFALVDASAVYVLSDNSAANGGLVERVTTVEPVFTNWVLHRDYTNTGIGGGVILQRLGEEIIYMHNGTVIGITLPLSGWYIGQIAMA